MGWCLSRAVGGMIGPGYAWWSHPGVNPTGTYHAEDDALGAIEVS